MILPTRLVTFLLILAGGAPTAGAAIIPADPPNYRALIPTLQPGDTLDLAAGDYPDGLPITDLMGTPAEPIVITGPETGGAAVLLANGSRNTVSIRRSAYVTLRYLTMDGLLIDYVDAIKLEGDADNWGHHIIIEHCTIVNHDPNQQTVGISTKAPAWDWIIRYNVIHSAGTGMYLGSSNGEAPFVRGLIEFNLVADPEGYCKQIKHQNPRPGLAGMPPDGSVTIVRPNVFIKDDDPSGDGDRPNALIGHLPLSGDGQNDHYELYGSFFYQQMANLATREGVEGRQRLTIHTPLIALTKGQIVRRRLDIGVDYGETCTCYDPSPDGEACGECDACLLRLKGFAENGLRDPAPYLHARSELIPPSR